MKKYLTIVGLLLISLAVYANNGDNPASEELEEVVDQLEDVIDLLKDEREDVIELLEDERDAVIELLEYEEEEEEGPTNEELEERIDQLEAELEEVKLEVLEENPIQNGSAMNWGTGLSIGIRANMPLNFGFDVMYTFPLTSKGNGSNGDLEKNVALLGFGLQVSNIDINMDFNWDFSDFEDFRNFNFSVSGDAGIKIALSTPVLLNFLSFSAYATPYADLSYDYNSNDFNIAIGSYLGGDVNFWFTQGFNMYLGLYTNPTFISINDAALRDWDMNVEFGVNFYCRKKR